MSSGSVPNSESQYSLLRVTKALISMPAQMLFYGSAVLAVAATGGTELPGILGTLAATLGVNTLSTMLERVARGAEISDDEIRDTVAEVIASSGIENLVSSNEFQRAIGHLFRQLDILKYAVQKGEIVVANMLSEQFAQHEVLLQELQNDLAYVREKIGNLATSDQAAEMLEILKKIDDQGRLNHTQFPIELVDQKIEDELDLLRKSRFFQDFDRPGFSIAFARRLVEGELSGGSPASRSCALAWCSRVLSSSGELIRAEVYLEIAKNLGSQPELRIAEAFIQSQKGERNIALGLLSHIERPLARSAALMIVSHHDGPSDAIDWLKVAGFTMADLDSDGKYFLVMQYFQLAKWEEAREMVALLTDEDFQETPVLYHVVATSYLLDTVPVEFRQVVLSQVPFDGASFPLAADSAAIDARRHAHQYYLEAAKVATQLNCMHAAVIDDEYALWLELRDPAKAKEGKERLKEKLRDLKSGLRLVHFGFQFGLTLDLNTIEREIERHIAIHGGFTREAAVARFAFAFIQNTPEEAANYVARHMDDIAKFLDKKFMLDFQIEMWVRARQPERAKACLDLLLQVGISEPEEDRIRRRIAEAEGADAVETRKEQFEKTDSLSDLALLIEELEKRQDWDSVCIYGETLFKRTRAVRDAERLVYALGKTNKHQEAVEFLENNQIFLAQSSSISLLYCWSLYYEGLLLKARSELLKLSDYRNEANYRSLLVNISSALGDWATLLAYVAEEWQQKDLRSAQELITAAQLALYLGSPHAKGLLIEAATKGKNDANILTTAYFSASRAGWENEPEVAEWLKRAAELSGENGPIQRMTLKDFLDQKPDWDRHETETWQMLSRGEIPMFIAARSLNKTLTDLMLFPAFANLTEIDPRRRAVIPAYNGVQLPKLINVQGTTGIDVSALLTLAFLNLLEKVLDTFDTIYLPHSTLDWLFQEKQRVAFHQPSRIKSAHRLRHLIAIGAIEILVPSTVPNSELAVQVGGELAQLIAEAEKTREDDNAPRVVIRPSPVHQLTSLLDEEADMTSHAAVLSSCQFAVNKLREKGLLTSEEEKKARAYLQLQEKPWPNQPDIADGAILYLDDLTVTYLLDIGIIDKLRTAGYRPIISPRKVSEINSLISYEGISDQVNEAIEHIRAAVSVRIESGKIKLDKQRGLEELRDPSVSEHPTIGVIGLASKCDVIIADDRFLNQNANIDDGNAQAPVFSTLDLLNTLVASRSITPAEGLEYRTRLRRAEYIFMPVSEDELAVHLNASTIRDNKVIENAELKAIRENLLRVRMSSWLQAPREALWLDTSIQVLIQVLRKSWKAGMDITTVRSQSDWILNQVDIRGWAHILGENGGKFIKEARTPYVMMLLAPLSDTESTIKGEYWAWVEDRILKPIQDDDSELYASIVLWYRKKIAEMADTDLEDRGDDI